MTKKSAKKRAARARQAESGGKYERHLRQVVEATDGHACLRINAEDVRRGDGRQVEP